MTDPHTNQLSSTPIRNRCKMSLAVCLPLIVASVRTPLLADVGVPVVALVAVASGLAVFLVWGVVLLQGRLAQSTDAERIVAHANDGILTLDDQGNVRALNPAAEGLFGYKASEVVGKAISFLIEEPLEKTRPRPSSPRLPVGSVVGVAAGARELHGKRKGGETFPLEISFSEIPLGEKKQRVAFVRDVSKRKLAQKHLWAHYAATRTFAEAGSLAAALPRVLQEVCGHLGWEVGEFWRLDRSAGVLRCCAAHAAPAPGVAEFSAIRKRAASAPEVGLAGRVWSSRETTWVADLASTSDVSSPALALEAGLCWGAGVPVLLGGEIEAVLLFFGRQLQKPDEVLTRMLNDLANQLGQFVRRKDAEEEVLRAREAADAVSACLWSARVDPTLALSGRSEGWEYRYWSTGVEKLTGEPPSVFLTSGPGVWESLVHPDDCPAWRSTLNEARKGRSTVVEYRLTRTDGKTIWVRESITATEREDGRSLHLDAVITDVTERREAEESARESDRRFRELMDQAGDAIFVHDEGGRFIDVNRQACTCLGYTREELLDLSELEVEQTHPLEEHPELETRMRSGESVTVQGVLRRKDGSALPVEVRVARLHVDGRPVKVSIARDVTERIRLEDQLRQAQKMEAIGQLAGGVAHDFNNLLTVIRGYGELMLADLTPEHSHWPALQEINTAAKRAADMTSQLLAFGRKAMVIPRILDLGEAVQHMQGMLRRLIGEDIDLVVSVDLGGLIKIDPGQLHQLILNLAVNARDAMPQGGRLSISVIGEPAAASSCLCHTSNGAGSPRLDAQGRVSPADGCPCHASNGEVGQDSSPGRMVLLVRDTGVGMAEETQTRIFEPFFSTKGEKGTGLGLATVYGIVKQAGGHIEVESALGKGTTFRIYLPCTEEQRMPCKSHPGRLVKATGEGTVLLVEDEDGVRSLVRHVLRECGYTVLEAADGEEALKMGTSHAGKIDLLLTDVVMPRLGGRQVAEHLGPLHPNMRILFLSGYTDDTVMRHGIIEQQVHFLSKPFSPGILAGKVREVLAS